MPVRAAFDLPWSEFVERWCLGVAPAMPQNTALEALQTLDRLWPEQLEQLEHSGQRGIGALLGPLYIGSCLCETEGAQGFAEVLARARSGEEAAATEIEAVAGLKRAGLVPRFTAPHAGKVLDAAFEFGDRTHFVEVVAPIRSAAIFGAQNYVGHLSRLIATQNAGFMVHVVLSNTDSVAEDIAAHIGNAAPTIRSEAQEGAVFSKVPVGGDASPNTEPQIATPVLVTVHGVVTAGKETARATVRLAMGDGRAKRLLDAERAHFARDQANLLIMNITRVVADPDRWIALITSCFQPSQNRRIGAVVLHSARMFAGAGRVWQRWVVLPNPHATTQLDESLLDALKSLDDGDYMRTPSNDLASPVSLL